MKNRKFIFSEYLRRIWSAIRQALLPALIAAVWLVKITIPLSLAVTLLGYIGVTDRIAVLLNPLFRFMGLPGEASLVFISSVFLNIYAAIAVLAQFSFNIREITILAVMCLIAHNLFIETAVQYKTGSKIRHILALRLSWAIIAGLLLNLILPSHIPGRSILATSAAAEDFPALMADWIASAGALTLRIVLLVTILMIVQQILKEFGALQLLAKGVTPLLVVFGLPRSTSFLWIVANTIGLAYGAAVMVEEVKNGTVTRRDADLLNHHIAISHSNLEDVLLFAAIGAPVAWILIPRLIIAAIAVWGRRLILCLR